MWNVLTQNSFVTEELQRENQTVEAAFSIFHSTGISFYMEAARVDGKQSTCISC